MKPERYTWDYTNVTDEALKQLITSANAELEKRRDKKADSYRKQLLALIAEIESNGYEVTFGSICSQCFDINVRQVEYKE